MQITVESTGPCRKRIRAEYSAEETRRDYDDLLAVYARYSHIRGFRPGRAPLDMVRRKYDKQILEDLRENLLSRGFREALQQHKLEPVAEYDLEAPEVKAGEPYSFAVTVDVEPDFSLPAYKGIEIEAREVAIAEEAVSEAIERYREKMGKYEDLAEPRPVQAGDMVAVDYTAEVEGRPLAELDPKAASLASGTDFWVHADEEFSFLPGFGPQLVGLAVGQSKDIAVSFDEQSPLAGLRGKTAVFHTTVKKIRAKTKAALDEEFFRSVGVKDEAQLREVFRGMLQAEAERREQARRRDQLLDRLLKKTELEVPASAHQEESQRIIYDVVRENIRRGVPEEKIRDHLGAISESAQGTARERLKLRYLLRRIAREENLTVSEAEVSALMEAEAKRAGFPGVKQWLQAAKLKESEIRRLLREDLLTAKTIDLLMGSAKLAGAAPPPPEGTS